MKRIEDIEKMGLEDLEKAAMEEKVPVPEGLAERIQERLAAAEFVKEDARQQRTQPQRTQKLQWVKYSGIAAAVATGIVLLASVPGKDKGQLQDTFEDPYMAYAQVEEAFRTISDKMAIGVDIAAQAKPIAEKPLEILSNTTKQNFK